MNARKTLLRIAVIVVVVVAAIAVAVFSRRVKDGRRWVASIEESRVLAESADTAYRSVASAESAGALRHYLEYLENLSPYSDPWQSAQHPLLSAEGLAFERLLAAGRLAMVEEHLGNSQAAEEYWVRAERHASATKLEAKGRASLRELVLRVDANAKPDRRPSG